MENQLAERKLALEEVKLRLEEKKLVADIHLKSAQNSASTLSGMSSLDQGASVDDILPLDGMDSQVQNLVAQERGRHFSKDEFIQLASQMLSQMQTLADGISDAINTAVTTPMPEQKIEITKTDNGLTGTIK